MYNKNLDTFLLVAEYKSFSKAAETLYITPSAVIQQINRLEQELGVCLFHRNRHGLELTEAGLYLKEAAAEYIRLGDDILYNLKVLSNRDHYIYVGTSPECKIRLLYDLWIKFRDRIPSYDIRPVNIDYHSDILQTIDLIESPVMNVVWQSDLKFLQLGRTPLVCAVSADHPLAGYSHLCYSDLVRYPVIIQKTVLPEEPNAFRVDLRSHKLHLLEDEGTDFSALVWDCVCRHQVLLVPECWNDILTDMVIIPCEWDYFLPYGLFYHDIPSEAVMKFLELVKSEAAQPSVT